MTWLSDDVGGGNTTPPPFYNSTPNPCGTTEDEGPPIDYSIYSRVAIILILVLLMALTAAGNSLVVCSIFLYRQMRTRTNFFVLSLGQYTFHRLNINLSIS